MWYGKGPGVERSTDAMRTASYQGVAPTGGVLALAGDDHNARSTVTAQQSELLFTHMHMPVLNPATVQEYLDFGLAGWALSRFASSWVGMICLNDTVDSAATVDIDPRRPALVVPGRAWRCRRRSAARASRWRRRRGPAGGGDPHPAAARRPRRSSGPTASTG